MASTLILALTLIFSTVQTSSNPVTLDPSVAESLLLERPAPAYSELAQRARVDGTVTFLALISDTGTVLDVKVISGHPLLGDGARQAVMQSRYKPYLQNGKAAPFLTEVEVVFLPELTERDYARDIKLAPPYFEQEVKCRELVDTAKWQEAGEKCIANLSMADKLGSLRARAKMHAYRLAGQAMLGQEKYTEALNYLKRARSIAKEKKYGEAEMGEILFSLGAAYLKMGKPADARGYFTDGEKALQAACNSTRTAALNARYISLLRESMKLHIEAAMADGAAKEAESLKKQLSALP